MTIGQFCAESGIPKPARAKHASRTCAECGAEDFMWLEQYRGPGLDPDSWTGNDIEVCASCQTPTGRVERYGWAV